MEWTEKKERMMFMNNVAIGNNSEDNKHEITNTNISFHFFVCSFFFVCRYFPTERIHTFYIQSSNRFARIFSLRLTSFLFNSILFFSVVVFVILLTLQLVAARRPPLVLLFFPWKSVIFDRRDYANTAKAPTRSLYLSHCQYFVHWLICHFFFPIALTNRQLDERIVYSNSRKKKIKINMRERCSMLVNCLTDGDRYREKHRKTIR